MHALPQMHVTSAALLPLRLRMPSAQDLFYEDATVLFIDMHQHEVWPGSGHASESGRGAGEGYTINVPMPGAVHHITCMECTAYACLLLCWTCTSMRCCLGAGMSTSQAEELGRT